MKKLLIACAAVMTAAVAMATMSFAAEETIPNYDVGTTEVSLSKSVDGFTNATQLTVIVVSLGETDTTLPANISDGQIVYIDQAEKGTTGFAQDMKVKGDTGLAKGNYIIAVGSDDTVNKGIVTELFTVGADSGETDPDPEQPPVVDPPATTVYGDLNGDSTVNWDDFDILQRHLVPWPGYGYVADEYFEEANVQINKDTQAIDWDDFDALQRSLVPWPGYSTDNLPRQPEL